MGYQSDLSALGTVIRSGEQPDVQCSLTPDILVTARFEYI